MHILIIPSWYDNNTNRILGSFFKEQAHALKDSGFKVTIAYAGFNGIRTIGKNKHGFSFNVEDGIPTYRYETFNFLYNRIPIINLQPFLYKYKIKKIYNKILQEQGKPDIIHVHSCIWAGLAAIELGKLLDVPVVITEHSSAFLSGKFKMYEKKVISKSLNNANAIIAVSNGLKDMVEKYTTNTNTFVVPNIVDTNLFNFKEIEVYGKDKFVFSCIGNLCKDKGIDILIEAFALAFKGENVMLKIVGDGVDSGELKKLAMYHGVINQIEFTGRLSREQVAKVLKNSDAFVLPSRLETFGVVFIEALACGVPVIGTKVCGPIEIINENNGYLVESENYIDLANAMKNMVINKDSFNSFQMSQNCIKKYSQKNIIDKLKEIYDSLVMN